MTRFYVSGSSDRFAQVASQWLGKTPLVMPVNIEAYGSPLKVAFSPDITEAVA